MRLTKFEKLLTLEKLHNVESGNTFRNNNMCREFNDHIANNLALKGLQNLKSSNFHGALWDGTTLYLDEVGNDGKVVASCCEFLDYQMLIMHTKMELKRGFMKTLSK